MVSLFVPLDLVPLFPDDGCEHVSFLGAYVDQLLHLSDFRLHPTNLHLLHDHHQEQSYDGDNKHERTDPDAFFHGIISSRLGLRVGSGSSKSSDRSRSALFGFPLADPAFLARLA